MSSWPLLSFPTKGELSVPCCLLTICNRCKYLLLINSLKEMQRWVCGEALCWRGPGVVQGCVWLCVQPPLAFLAELQEGCCEDALDLLFQEEITPCATACPRAQICQICRHSTVWGKFENQELLQGMDACKCCSPAGIPHCSLATPLALRTWTEQGKVTIVFCI